MWLRARFVLHLASSSSSSDLADPFCSGGKEWKYRLYSRIAWLGRYNREWCDVFIGKLFSEDNPLYLPEDVLSWTKTKEYVTVQETNLEHISTYRIVAFVVILNWAFEQRVRVQDFPCLSPVVQRSSCGKSKKFLIVVSWVDFHCSNTTIKKGQPKKSLQVPWQTHIVSKNFTDLFHMWPFWQASKSVRIFAHYDENSNFCYKGAPLNQCMILAWQSW